MARRVAKEMTVEAFDARTKSYEVEEVEDPRFRPRTFYFAAARTIGV